MSSSLLGFPSYVSYLSCILITAQQIRRALLNRDHATIARPENLDRHENAQPDPNLDFYTCTRLISCITSLGCSLFACLYRETDWNHALIVASDAYISTLALVILFPAVSRATGKRFGRHVNVILFVSFATYGYRNLWPLAIIGGTPQDNDGPSVWIKSFALFYGCVLPLITPRVHYSLKKSYTEEQSASILSLLTHSYLDGIIWLANVQGNLTAEQIPALAKEDSAEHIIHNCLQKVDPYHGAKPRYLFWALVYAFRTKVLIMFVLEFFKMMMVFVAPWGIKQLLSYLEDRYTSKMKPWFWITWLFIGPFFGATVAQFYTYIACRNTLHVEGLLTQLVFEHSLRLRIIGNNDVSTKNTTKRKDLMGRISNLVSSDLLIISNVSEVWISFAFSPISIVGSMVFLYLILGWSAFVGLGFMIVSLPLPGFLSRLVRSVQIKRMKKSDSRVQTVVEAMSIMRMVKLLGWESMVAERIDNSRINELQSVRTSKILDLLINHLNYCIPLLTMIITYATYTLAMKKPLTSAIVFSSYVVFEALRLRIRHILSNMATLLNAKVSLDRVDDFLKTSELLDTFRDDAMPIISSNVIECRCNDVEFVWSTSPTSFKLRIEGPLVFKMGINMVVGPTSSGKTSLLNAFLGEMQCSALTTDSFLHVSRTNGIGYAPQESWVQNDTIKNNIIFGYPFDEDRYKDVLYQCALLPDLDRLEAGDLTEVGEKGITLSGGQKARVTLARALYSPADILFLDDTLASLDAQTANWIVEKCLTGALMKDRIIVLVTNNVALALPVAQHVVFLKLDGSIVQGAPKDVLSSSLLNESQSHTDTIDSVLSPNLVVSESKGDEPMSSHRLIASEELEEGHVKIDAWRLYLGNLSKHSTIFWSSVVGAIFSNMVLITIMPWFLGHWSAQYDIHKRQDVDDFFYLSVYIGMIILSMSIYTIAFTVYTLGTIRAGKVIHSKLIHSVLGTTLNWLDRTPVSRVITRATVDMQAVDGRIATNVWNLVETSLGMIVKFASILLVSPSFIIPGLSITVMGGYMGQVYMKARLPCKRIMSTKKSPILTHIATSLDGISCIRAFGVQQRFLDTSMQHIDGYLHPAITFLNLNRWVALRSEALAGIFSSLLAIYLVYGSDKTSAANTGFSLTMAVAFSSSILIFVRMYNDAELSANSLERIHQYLNIEQEPTATASGVPSAYWPASGELKVKNLTARYAKNGPDILHNLSFTIESGQHIGVVGRTGSGKSSLTLALLRCIPTRGTVYYDGLPTDSLNLDVLRSAITIIPQVPDLLSGTLRDNLDPFLQHSDLELHEALRSAGLFSLQEDDYSNGLSLDSAVADGGKNLSVGQRQIIALARAILRGSKVLILDEATSAIDSDTDKIIQRSLRKEMASVTLITVAHRLHTVMDYDRILVLQDGQMVEFDKPSVLLANKDGFLRKLVDQSPDRDDLEGMANK